MKTFVRTPTTSRFRIEVLGLLPRATAAGLQGFLDEERELTLTSLLILEV
jgi:hypothetical protein